MILAILLALAIALSLGWVLQFTKASHGVESLKPVHTLSVAIIWALFYYMVNL